MRKRYVVRNGASFAGFSERVIDDLKMLGLIQFRGITRTPQGVIYNYTGAGDNRKPVHTDRYERL